MEGKVLPITVDDAGSALGVGSGVASSVIGLPRVERNTLQEQAYESLRQALMAGRFIPGESITLRAAAEALGTSPMPARDALRRLAIEHALVPKPNRTLEVPEMTYASLIELRDVRMALEGLATEKAAVLIAREEIDAADRLYRRMAEAAHAADSAAYMLANWSFHSAIYRASRSKLLVSMIEPTWMRIGPYVHLMLPDRKSLVASLDNHLRAVEALRRRDAQAARYAMQQDIHDSAEGLARLLLSREGSAEAPADVESGTSAEARRIQAR